MLNKNKRDLRSWIRDGVKLRVRGVNERKNLNRGLKRKEITDFRVCIVMKIEKSERTGKVS